MKTFVTSLVSTVPFAVIIKQGVSDYGTVINSSGVSEDAPIMCEEAPYQRCIPCLLSSSYHVVKDQRTSIKRPGTSFCFVHFFVEFPGFHPSFFCKENFSWYSNSRKKRLRKTTTTSSRPMWTMWTTVTRRTSTSTTCARFEHACTLVDVCLLCHWYITPTLTQGLLSLSSHLHAMHMSVSLWVARLLLLPLSHFTVFFPSILSMYSDNFDSVTNNLRKSANGTFVTSDDSFPFTGYEPNDTELINDMELNDSVISKFLNSQDPSSTLLRHQTRTWMTWHSASYSLKHTEITPITAVRKVYVSVRRQCLSWSIERGNLWKRVTSISLVLVSETCTVLKISFLQSLKLKEWSIERGNPWEKAVPVHRLGLCLMNKDERSS